MTTPTDTAAMRELESKATKPFLDWKKEYYGGPGEWASLEERHLRSLKAAFVRGAQWQACDEIDALRARVAELEEFVNDATALSAGCASGDCPHWDDEICYDEMRKQLEKAGNRAWELVKKMIPPTDTAATVNDAQPGMED